ncbi:multicopper oxidase domain-containing protein [Marivita sp.]|uniref:multicopper oxidase domain-containing protein n=1 Tax=Marivita sp. TaxID=2003365 RepID=UPI003B51C509
MTLLKANTNEVSYETHLRLRLCGDARHVGFSGYGRPWGSKSLLAVLQSERVEMMFDNMSITARPMHLQDHVLQVVDIIGIGSQSLSATRFMSPLRV